MITPGVEALRGRFGLPGMKILQFAFGGAHGGPFFPHMLTGTTALFIRGRTTMRPLRAGLAI